MLELLEQSLKEILDIDTKSRIEGCKNQMKLFKFYFGLNLSERLYVITDNLSKTLPQEKMSALRGKESADLTVQTLENMRNEHNFSLLYKKIKVSASKIEAISPPAIQESEESTTIQYCITLQETQGQQQQRIIQKIRMNITNRFVTKLWILLLTPSKIDLTNQHLSCLLKQSSCF